MAFFSRGLYRTSQATAVLLGFVPGPSLVNSQEPLPALQFNVPYRCADGTTYVIQRCEPVRNGEVCYFRIEKNGQLLKEAYNIRSQMTGIVKTCPVQASSQPGPPLNPPYLREMPSVERVRAQIQARNPIKGVRRQLAAV